MMKKLTAGLALAGVLAGMVGTSYAGPSTAPVADGLTSYQGDAAETALVAKDYVVHLEYSDYVLHLEWSGLEAAAAPTGAETDALFDK